MRFLHRLTREHQTETHTEAERFRAEVISRGQFAHDWFTVHIPQWETLLQEHEPRQALELGCYEGLATCYLLWRLPDVHVTAVDTFGGVFGEPDLERRFDHNIALLDASRVDKLVGKTRDHLPRLLDDEVRFDFIYVDASHLALDVLADAALSWPLLRSGGLMLFDDYGLPREDPLHAPDVAVDAFFEVVKTEADRRMVGRQVALAKRSIV